MSQGIIEGRDRRVGEAVEGRIRAEIGLKRCLGEGLEEMWGKEGETVMGGKEKRTSDNTIRCLCTGETEICEMKGVIKENSRLRSQIEQEEADRERADQVEVTVDMTWV